MFKYRHSIVIANRRPFVLMLEVASLTIGIVVNVLRWSCLFNVGFTILGLHLTLARFSYVVHYLTDSKAWLLSHSLLWHGNKLRKIPLLMTYLLIIVLSFISMISADPDTILTAGCPDVKHAARIPFIYSYYVLFFMYSAYILRNRLIDRIGFRIELVGSFFSFVILNLIYIGLYVVYQLQFEYLYFCLFANYGFWGLYFPVLYSKYFRYSLRNKSVRILNVTITYEELLEEAKKHYCIELVQFLMEYEAFILTPSDAGMKSLIRRFILPNSPKALNLSEDMVHLVDMKGENLREVKNSVDLMIYENLLVKNE